MFDTCEYIISATSKKQFPNVNNYPEFVFLGRSNVGKSSFINALTGRKNLARTSSKPGKTIAINFFEIDKKMYFVDVPGYGYAMRAQDTRMDFGKYIEDYLDKNSNLKMAFLLVDTKVGATSDDKLMFNYLKYLNIPTTIIATKCDKIGVTKYIAQNKMISSSLEVERDKVILTSSETKYGFDKVLDIITKLI